jgi:hypothetical protein
VSGTVLLAAELSPYELAAGIAVVASLVAGWALTGWDLMRRDDLSRGARAGWAVVAVLLAWIGIIAYWLFRPPDASPAERARRQQASDEFVARHTMPPE